MRAQGRGGACGPAGAPAPLVAGAGLPIELRPAPGFENPGSVRTSPSFRVLGLECIAQLRSRVFLWKLQRSILVFSLFKERIIRSSTHPIWKKVSE